MTNNTKSQLNSAMPYYKWYQLDFRASRNVQRMNYIERGLYRELLDECWSEGSIPNDIESLAEICGCPLETMANAWQMLSKCFVVVESTNRLVNQKLELQRTEKDAERLKRKQSGRLGGIAKSLNHKDDPSNCLPNASTCLAIPKISHIAIAEHKHKQEHEHEQATKSVDSDESPSIPLEDDRGRRLTEKDLLTEDWIKYCKTTRPDLDPQTVFKNFQDFWLSKAGAGARKTNWTRTWQTWVRNQHAPKVKKSILWNGIADQNFTEGVTEDGRF